VGPWDHGACVFCCYIAPPTTITSVPWVSAYFSMTGYGYCYG